jgi:signal peptidase I
MPSEPGAQPDHGAPEHAAAADDPAAEGTSTPDDGREPEGDDARGKRKRPWWRDLLVIVVAALALTILLKAFVVQVFSIPSASMENTLLVGDRILVSKIVYDFRPIERGDVVVFSGAGSWDPPTPAPSGWLSDAWDHVVDLVGIAGPGTDYVKRVIGVPGDHVVCCNSAGQITVNGVALSESSYIYPGAVPSMQKINIVVPPGRLWVMGDNRADSDDSRFRASDPGQGTIPESAVVGRAFLIIWPLSRATDIPIPNTFQQAGLSAAAAFATAPTATTAGGAALAGAAVVTWRRRRRR